MDGMREGLLGVLCISKCNIVEIPLAFPFSSVRHKVLLSRNDHLSDFCLSRAVLFREAGGCSPGFRVLCLTMRFPTTKSEVLPWGVAVILGEKGYWNVWGSHNWRWEISFCTEKILIFSKSKWKCLFLCQSWVGAAEKPEPKWLDFFPLMLCSNRNLEKKSNQVRWKQAVSLQLCPASCKSSDSENETWESWLAGLWLQCPVCRSWQPCQRSQTLVHLEEPYLYSFKLKK